MEGDIKACFDEIDHAALLGRVRFRIGDKRLVSLVKAFLLERLPDGARFAPSWSPAPTSAPVPTCEKSE